jgi:hypothetical protein
VARKRKTPNGPEEAEDRPEKAGTKVTVERQGDIDWGEIPSTEVASIVKARSDTVEEADLEAGDEALGFGLGPEDDEGDDETPRPPRAAPYVGRKAAQSKVKYAAPVRLQPCSEVPAHVADRNSKRNRTRTRQWRERLEKDERLRAYWDELIRTDELVWNAPQGLVEHAKPVKRETAQRPPPSPWPRQKKITVKIFRKYDIVEARRQTRELLEQHRKTIDEWSAVVSVPEGTTSARRGRRPIGKCAMTDAERKRRQRERAKERELENGR